MKTLALCLGVLALIGTIAPPILNLLHLMEASTMKTTLLASCVLWFVTAPLWMKSE